VSLKQIGEMFDAMQSMHTDSDLRREMETFAKKLGFDTFVYALRITAPSLAARDFLLSGYPKGWVALYMASRYFAVDPVVQHCQRSSLPVIWDASTPGDGRASEFWEEARSFGLQAGVSFSVHELPGITGIFSLSRDVSLDLHGESLDALVGKAQVFASVLHHSVLRMHLPKLVPQATVDLTARERECLKWSAAGKTTREVGVILGITERTAVFHMNNVVQKLGAANKTQAIVRALALNYI
jgi:LuxR family quorum-sensing system transcriptional regulator SolR